MEVSRSNIKRRLVKYVADLWGYQQADMDGFDPLVDLLLGACAVEFERTGNQIISSQSRVLEKLAHLLLPESLVTPLPAHTVLHSQPVEPHYSLQQQDQFSFDKEVINPAKPTEISNKSVFFSPTLPVSIFNASVQYVASGRHLRQQLDVNNRELLHSTKKGAQVPNQQVWLGIRMNPKLEYIPPLSFFFDWRNHPEKQKFINLVPISQCSVGDYKLTSRSGYGLEVEEKVSKLRNTLVNEWDILPKIEDKVNQLYEQHFLTLNSSEIKLKECLQPYPEPFAEWFEEEALQEFTEPLLWLEFSLSQLIPQDAIEEMTLALNCFPACNRQLIDNRRPYRLDDSLNIIPLKSEDYFLAVHQVSSGDGQPLQALPFFDTNQIKPGKYAIRRDRVAKFDSRNAREMLQYVLELMRDEAAAFTAASGAIGSKEILELEQNLNRIENNLAKKASSGDTEQYLMLKPDKNRDIYVSFWNTSGALANKIPAGSAFKTRAVDIQSGSSFSMTTSFGGKDKPSEQEKLYTFRSNLLSRERIVTREDIRAACFAELGDKIAHVDIKKGFYNEASYRQGLTRILSVEITPHEDNELSDEDWDKICEELSLNLQQRSSIFLPIQVKIAPAEVI